MPGFYPHRCNIQARAQIGSDGLGPVEGWVARQKNVPCKFEMMSADMVLRLYGEGVIRAARLWLPPEATIHENSYQVTTTQGIFTGTWIVKSVKQYTVLPHWEVDLIPDMSTTAGQ
jgi:hypothetical protein